MDGKMRPTEDGVAKNPFASRTKGNHGNETMGLCVVFR